LLIVFTLIKYPPTQRLDLQFKSFYTDSVEIIKKVPELFYYNTYNGEEIINTGPSGYLVIFNSGVQVWKQNKMFGGGLKSFRLNCIYGNSQTCNSHPHNYSIELLVDVGIVGFVLIYLIFIFSFFDYFKYYRQNLNSKILTVPFFLIVFLEFFPMRSTGSFFTTSVATVIFLMLAIMMGFSNSRVK
jgi:O-antigen ligase